MLKILVVEDEQEILENVVELLQLSNFEAYGTLDAASGMQIVEEWLPDIVLCDITMSGINGYDFLQYLQSKPQTANLPLIFLSARADAKTIQKAQQMGAAGYVIKPFTSEQLLNAIHECIAIEA